MYVIAFEKHSALCGPFKTANAAAAYAVKNFDRGSWRIVMLMKPE